MRPLDPAIRSETVIERDVTTVVINSRHPLFLKRGGDIWYQLEAAAREVFKSFEGARRGRVDQKRSCHLSVDATTPWRFPSRFSSMTGEVAAR